MTISTAPSPRNKSRRARLDVEPELLRARQVAQILSISETTVWRLDAAERIPAPLRCGGITAWRRAELLAWVDRGMPDRAAWGSLWPKIAADFVEM